MVARRWEDQQMITFKEDTINFLEDFALGFLAKERHTQSKPADYIPLEEIKKKLNKKNVS